MDEDSRSKGWWQTVPGILTAVAGVITAVAGLIIALHQAGLFDREGQRAPQVQSGAVKPREVTKTPEEPPREETSTLSTGKGPSSVILPSGTEVRVEHYVYKIVASQLDRYGPNQNSLKLRVRMTNHSTYPGNFWAASFRLLVNGVPQAPENDLNEIVDGNSAKEGIVEFVIPDTATEVGLQVGKVGEGSPTIPIALRAAKS